MALIAELPAQTKVYATSVTGDGSEAELPAQTKVYATSVIGDGSDSGVTSTD